MSSPTRGVGLCLGVCVSLIACASPVTPTPSPAPAVTAAAGPTLPAVTVTPIQTPAPLATASGTPVLTPGSTGSTQSAPPPATAGPPSATPILASSPSPAPPAATPGSAGPMALVIADQGFTAGAGGIDSAAYGLVLSNPNATVAAHSVHLMVDFFDGTGDFLAGSEVFVTLLPGQASAIAGNVFGAGAAARMEVAVPDDPTGFVAPRSAGRFDITGKTSFDDGLVITTGELRSHFASDQRSVQVTVIYRNSAGAIVGGANGGVELVEAGERAAFDIVDGTSYPDITATELYWQLSSALE